MGRSWQVACKDCKTNYYLGYGSYGSRDYYMCKFPEQEHKGHSLIEHFEDCCTVRDNGNLESDYGGGDNGYGSYVLIEGFSSFKEVDLSGEGWK